MNIKVLNIDGNPSKDINVSDKLTGLKVNNRLLKYVIDWQLNHSKKRVAKTKQRNEVIGSTRKIYAQKGTGGARHASRKAPLFVGGGVAHGPKGDNYKVKKINKKIGIWVKDKKIAAIGIRVSRWIAYHGFSININNDLNEYKKIIPCGLDNKNITSIKKERNKFTNIESNLKKIILKNISKI